jgi:hypothetical protein
MLRARRVILVAVALSAAVACAESKVNLGGPRKASFEQIEKQLGHNVAEPKPSFGATLIASALVRPAGETFKGATAGSSYRWNDVLVLMRQGHPVDGFALHRSIQRGDAIYRSLANGAEVALLPQAGSSSAMAYVESGDWLIHVDIPPAKNQGRISLDDLKAFVDALEL